MDKKYYTDIPIKLYIAIARTSFLEDIDNMKFYYENMTLVSLSAVPCSNNHIWMSETGPYDT